MAGPSNIPKHVAIIMDGNGRWAKRQGLPRTQGHQVGVDRVEEVARFAAEIGVQYLTLYAFSKENWNRPRQEVDFLMKLLSSYLDRYLEEKKKDDVVGKMVFKTIGKTTDLPLEVQKKVAQVIEATQNNPGLVLTFALSYSARLEIAEACQRIAQEVQEGRLDVKNITETTVSEHLYTQGFPDPDLLIRTSGEVRVSNFLLWQISYSEIYITEKCWPEFTKDEFLKALEAFQKRERRFGSTLASSKKG